MTERDDQWLPALARWRRGAHLRGVPAQGAIYGVPKRPTASCPTSGGGHQCGTEGHRYAVLNERAAAHDVQIATFNTYMVTDQDALFTVRPGGFFWCPEWNWWEASGNPKPEAFLTSSWRMFRLSKTV